MRDDTVRDDMARDDTLRDDTIRDDPAHYDQPRTDQIPAEDPGFAGGRRDPDDPRPDPLAAEPGFADEPGYADAPPDRAVPSAGPATGDPDPTPAQPASASAGPRTPDSASTEDSGAVLFGGPEVERFRGQWRDLQAGFVDNPQEAVRSADQLVDDVLRALTEVFNAHKQELETQWQGGETEELRLAMRRYRSFFDQLLNA